jgi:hypothetical protein
MKNKILVAGFVISSALLAGCAGGSYYVRTGPPAPRYGVVGVAPGPGYLWTDGYWDRRGNNWAWVGGSWVRPPRGRRVYVRPEWRQERGGWRLHRGHWR